MRLTSHLRLTEEQISEVRDLVNICNEYEQLSGEVFFSNQLNCDTRIKCYYCIRKKGELVGFLNMFIPTKAEAEITAYVLPEFRNIGIFTKMFEKACAELKRYGFEKILFVSQPQGKDCGFVLEKYHAQKDHSEYLMEFHGDSVEPLPTELKIRKAGPADRDIVSRLSEDAFEEPKETAEAITDNSLKSEHIDVYLAYDGDRPIGTMSTNKEGSDLYIYGVGVASDYQGRGIGKQMMNLLMQELIRMKDEVHIRIEADSKKPNAYGLYQKCGFDIITEFDYSSYQIENRV
ncbi:MAG: GNAT family N-acetyltransferase [Anaerofustis sp.]